MKLIKSWVFNKSYRADMAAELAKGVPRFFYVEEFPFDVENLNKTGLATCSEESSIRAVGGGVGNVFEGGDCRFGFGGLGVVEGH